MRYFIVSYIQTPGGKYNETVKVDDKVRNRDAVTATLIMDYKDRKIIKARLNEAIERDFDKISDFYKGHYPDVINALEAKFQALDEIKEEILEGDESETD